jgi:hypothetical protein
MIYTILFEPSLTGFRSVILIFIAVCFFAVQRLIDIKSANS